VADIKNKKTGPLPRQVKRIIKHAQSEKVTVNVDFGALLSDRVNIEEIVEGINKSREHTATTYDIKKGRFDFEAIYSERAIKLAHEMVKGFREGWSESSLNKREVCLNPSCLQLFWKEHENQEFCSDDCRGIVDIERSKRGMEERREEEERQKWGKKLLREEQKRFKAFEDFLGLAGSNDVKLQMKVGVLTKRYGWTIVNRWLREKDRATLWDSLPREVQDNITEVIYGILVQS